MDEKELQKLYDAMNSKFDVGDFNTFKTKMQTPEDRKKFYDVVGKNGFDLGDYNQFEERIAGVKKKPSNDGATGLAESSSTTQSLETEIPLVSLEDNETANPIDLAAKYFELSNKTKKESMPSSGKGGQNVMTVPDEGVKVDNNGQEYVMGGRKEAQDLKEFLKINRGVDADELACRIHGVLRAGGSV